MQAATTCFIVLSNLPFRCPLYSDFTIMTRSERIRRFYKELYKCYGTQGWWPGDSPLECAVGAILTQSTSWSNAAKALNNLKKNRLLSLEKLNLLTIDELASLIHSSGYYNQKAKKLKNFVRFVTQNYGGELERMFETNLAQLRNELLGVSGIGPETADSILLYAGNKPIFVIDSYTYRILSRHGLVPESASYGEMQELFMDSLAKDVQTYNEYHALLVRVAKEKCKKSSPDCEECPLRYDPHTA